MIHISLQNEGGELDSRLSASPEQALNALISMIKDMGELHPGDRIVVKGDEE